MMKADPAVSDVAMFEHANAIDVSSISNRSPTIVLTISFEPDSYSQTENHASLCMTTMHK